MRHMLITSNWAREVGLAMDGSFYQHLQGRKKEAKNASEPDVGRAKSDEQYNCSRFL